MRHVRDYLRLVRDVTWLESGAPVVCPCATLRDEKPKKHDAEPAADLPAATLRNPGTADPAEQAVQKVRRATYGPHCVTVTYVKKVCGRSCLRCV